jgi:PAS domain-containing protein
VQQRPLELIHARNFIGGLSTAAFLVDESGTVIFYNDAAATMLGRRFEEGGRMTADEWTTAFGPFDRDGEPVDIEELPLTQTLRHGRPAHSSFNIHSLDGARHDIEVSAMPIVAAGGLRGALAIFWPREEKGEQ